MVDVTRLVEGVVERLRAAADRLSRPTLSDRAVPRCLTATTCAGPRAPQKRAVQDGRGTYGSAPAC